MSASLFKKGYAGLSPIQVEIPKLNKWIRPRLRGWLNFRIKLNCTYHGTYHLQYCIQGMINISNVLTGNGLHTLRIRFVGDLDLRLGQIQHKVTCCCWLSTQIVRDLLAIVPDRKVDASLADTFQVLFLYIWLSSFLIVVSTVDMGFAVLKNRK